MTSSSSSLRLTPIVSPHHPPSVPLSFHKSHNEAPTCFLYLLTQHWGRTWKSEVLFWTRTECLCPPVCVCVSCSTEVLHWGQTVAPVGLTLSEVRMSAWFRGQGCNQTAGRLPRLLSCTEVDTGVCVCI